MDYIKKENGFKKAAEAAFVVYETKVSTKKKKKKEKKRGDGSFVSLSPIN